MREGLGERACPDHAPCQCRFRPKEATFSIPDSSTAMVSHLLLLLCVATCRSLVESQGHRTTTATDSVLISRRSVDPACLVCGARGGQFCTFSCSVGFFAMITASSLRKIGACCDPTSGQLCPGSPAPIACCDCGTNACLCPTEPGPTPAPAPGPIPGPTPTPGRGSEYLQFLLQNRWPRYCAT